MADVNWTVIAPLVAAAPQTANVPSDVVDHVVVQHWGFDPTNPMRILVYMGGGARDRGEPRRHGRRRAPGVI